MEALLSDILDNEKEVGAQIPGNTVSREAESNNRVARQPKVSPICESRAGERPKFGETRQKLGQSAHFVGGNRQKSTTIDFLRRGMGRPVTG